MEKERKKWVFPGMVKRVLCSSIYSHDIQQEKGLFLGMVVMDDN